MLNGKTTFSREEILKRECQQDKSGQIYCFQMVEAEVEIEDMSFISDYVFFIDIYIYLQ